MRAQILRTAAFCGALAGCGTLPTPQYVTINTGPEGATCDVRQGTEPVGSIASTPGSLSVDVDERALTITCRKDGYKEKSVTVQSHRDGTDSLLMAQYRYDPSIGIALEPVPHAVMQDDSLDDVRLPRPQDADGPPTKLGRS